MMANNSITSLGEYLRSLRTKQGFTLKEVSTKVGIDTSLLAKIERNERQPSKQALHNLANFFDCEEQQLNDQFLSDQIANKILSENADLSILKVAEQKVKYLKRSKNGKEQS